MYSVPLFLVLIALDTSKNSVRATPLPDNEEQVYNPSEKGVYVMPESCVEEGNPYCFEKGDYYPDSKVEQLVQKLHLIKWQGVTHNKPTFITDRDGFEPGPGNALKEPDCLSGYTAKPVYYILDSNDTVRVVLQGEDFNQTYDMEWCLNEGHITMSNAQDHALRHYHEKTLSDVYFECITTYMNVDFFVLNEEDPSDHKIEAILVKIPVCCRCRINAEKSIFL